MKILSIIPVLLTVSTVCLVFSACVQNATGGIIRADLNVRITKAKVEMVYPVNVVPGILCCVEGEGFGNTPALIRVGTNEVRDYLGWSDTQVFFRIPEGVKTGDKVSVGGLDTEVSLLVAGPKSVKVVWLVDTAKMEQKIRRVAGDFNVSPDTRFKPPLFVKGQWSKKPETFGISDGGWEGGSKAPMFNLPGTTVWTSECVFTPENQDTFSGAPMLFAIEDSEMEQRSISGFESDAAAILKIEWAKEDELKDVSSDPGVLVTSANPICVNGVITLKYPLK